MQELIKTKKPALSETVNCADFTHLSVQMTATGEDKNQAVKAHSILEGSLDGVGWIPVVELTVDGTGTSTDGGTFETLWRYVRVLVKTVSNKTDVSVYLAKRG